LDVLLGVTIFLVALQMIMVLAYAMIRSPLDSSHNKTTKRREQLEGAASDSIELNPNSAKVEAPDPTKLNLNSPEIEPIDSTEFNLNSPETEV
jgi:hypothetical protein